MTSEPWARLERLHAAATPGVWEAHKEPTSNLYSIDRMSEDDDDMGDEVASGLWDRDAEFIVAVHEALPGLLERMRAFGKPVQM